ncbi:MAG TPA: hypothetical protein VFQ54_01195, partial [Thermomicrobiales bacterium]|nr:hypothetical protein [Thermomicrobiales bacterium]
PIMSVVAILRPAWQMRPVVRAVNPGAQRRQITVIGDLSGLDVGDAEELGKLLGRGHGAIVMHGQPDERRLGAFRRGLTANEFPPVVIYLPTERKAINRALRTARKNDIVLMFPAGDPGPSIRAAARFDESALVSPDDSDD